MDRLQWSDGTAGQTDGEAGWWTSSWKIVLHPLARVKGVGRQQQPYGGTYWSMGLGMALYLARIVSFCFPHVDDVSALSICIVLRDSVVISMCLLYVSLGSRVSPSMFGLMFMESVMLSICSADYVQYSAGFYVKRMHVVLFELRMRLFVCVHVCISCRNDWMFDFTMFMSLCADVMVMSSA